MRKKVLGFLSSAVVLLGLAGFLSGAPLPPGFARWLVVGTISLLAGAMGAASLIHLWRDKELNPRSNCDVALDEQDPGKSRTDLKKIR